MAYDEALAARIRAVCSGDTAVTEKKMFGGVAFLRGGLMFVGVRNDTLMARVGPARHAEALAREHAREMDFTGRPMKGYVYVDAAGIRDDEALAGWVHDCKAFVATLPPKAAK